MCTRKQKIAPRYCVGLITIATKLAHPFDAIDRVPENFSDPSAVRIDWSKWVVTTSPQRPDRLQRGEEIHIKDTDVWGLSSNKLNDYLDWYQTTWIDDRDSKSNDLYFQLDRIY